MYLFPYFAFHQLYTKFKIVELILTTHDDNFQGH